MNEYRHSIMNVFFGISYGECFGEISPPHLNIVSRSVQAIKDWFYSKYRDIYVKIDWVISDWLHQRVQILREIPCFGSKWIFFVVSMFEFLSLSFFSDKYFWYVRLVHVRSIDAHTELEPQQGMLPFFSKCAYVCWFSFCGENWSMHIPMNPIQCVSMSAYYSQWRAISTPPYGTRKER